MNNRRNYLDNSFRRPLNWGRSLNYERPGYSPRQFYSNNYRSNDNYRRSRDFGRIALPRPYRYRDRNPPLPLPYRYREQPRGRINNNQQRPLLRNPNPRRFVRLGRRRDSRGDRERDIAITGRRPRRKQFRNGDAPNQNNNRNNIVNNNTRRTQKRVGRREDRKRKTDGLLYVTNLTADTLNEDLKKAFESYGKMMRCAVFFGPDGQSTGRGVVQFTNNSNSQRAFNDLNRTILKGSNILLEFGSKKKEKTVVENNTNNVVTQDTEMNNNKF